MTTRRSFLKRLAVVAAGFAAGANLLTDKATAKQPVVRFTTDGSIPTTQSPELNPAWINAPYQQEFLFYDDAFPGFTFGLDPAAPRYRIDDDGEWILVAI